MPQIATTAVQAASLYLYGIIGIIAFECLRVLHEVGGISSLNWW